MARPYITIEDYNTGYKCLNAVLEAFFVYGFQNVKVDGPLSYEVCLKLGYLVELNFPSHGSLLNFMKQFPIDVAFPDLPFRYFQCGGTRGKPTTIYIMTK